MAAWRHKIELNKVIREASEKHDLSRFEEPCPEEVKIALAEEVKKAWPLQRFAGYITERKSIAELNRILENLFNAADREKVWCGF